MSFVSEIEVAKNDLTVLAKLLATGEPLSEKNKENIKELAHKCAKLKERYYYKTVSNEDKTLKSAIDSLATISSAFALYEKGSAPFFLGLNLLRIGSETSMSATGFLGPSISKFLKDITKGITTLVYPKIDSGSYQYFESLVMTSMVLVAIGGFEVADNSQNLIPKNERDFKSTANFFLDLATTFLFHSTLLYDTFDVIGENSDIPANKNNLSAEILSLTAKIVFLITASYHDSLVFDYLVEKSKKNLLNSISSVGRIINDALADNIFSDELYDVLNVQLQQAKIAIQNNDNQNFLKMYQEFLEIGSINPGNINNDLNVLYDFKNLIKTTFTSGLKNQKVNQTEVFQSA